MIFSSITYTQKFQRLEYSITEACHVPACGGLLQLPVLPLSSLSSLPGGYEPIEALQEARRHTMIFWSYTSLTKILHNLFTSLFLHYLHPVTMTKTALVWCHYKIVSNHHLCIWCTWEKDHVEYKESSMKTGRSSFSHPQYTWKSCPIIKVGGFVTALPLLLTVSVHHKIWLSHVVIF